MPQEARVSGRSRPAGIGWQIRYGTAAQAVQPAATALKRISRAADYLTHRPSGELNPADPSGGLQGSDFGLLRDLQGIVYFDAQIPHGGLELRMSK